MRRWSARWFVEHGRLFRGEIEAYVAYRDAARFEVCAECRRIRERERSLDAHHDHAATVVDLGQVPPDGVGPLPRGSADLAFAGRLPRDLDRAPAPQTMRAKHRREETVDESIATVGRGGRVAPPVEGFADVRGALEQALDLGRRANDPTAQAYALAWLTWTMHSFGQCALATTYWPLIEALLPDIPDPFDRRYVQLKGRGGLAYALAARGERVAARAIAEELLEDGRRTGNRRATAMGQFPLIVLDATSGDPESGLRRAIVAAECGADPMYRLSADVWRAGMAATANGPAEALVIIEAGATDVRKLRIDHGVRRVPSVGRVPVRQARSPRSPARRCPRPLGPSRRTVGRRAGCTARARCRSAARHALNAVLLRRSGPPSMR